MRALAVLLIVFAIPQLVRADSQLLIISGLGGEEEFSRIFYDWSAALIKAARRSGVAPDNIVYLAEDPERDPQLIKTRSDKAAISAAIGDLSARAGPADDVYIFLFGHGSGRGAQTFFNIPGPDISAGDFARLLQPIASQRLVVVNATSSSGPFVRALSGPGRVIITATSKAAERYFPEFGGYFVAALDSDSADTDKDNKVSILEAFNFAKREVRREYDSDKRLLTEHALLDDNGDKEGSREPDPLTADGALAASLFLYATTKSADKTEIQAMNPRLSALLTKKADIENRILALRKRKADFEADAYYRQLEQLLLELAHNLKARRGEENTASGQDEEKS